MVMATNSGAACERHGKNGKPKNVGYMDMVTSCLFISSATEESRQPPSTISAPKIARELLQWLPRPENHVLASTT